MFTQGAGGCGIEMGHDHGTTVRINQRGSDVGHGQVIESRPPSIHTEMRVPGWKCIHWNIHLLGEYAGQFRGRPDGDGPPPESPALSLLGQHGSGTQVNRRTKIGQWTEGALPIVEGDEVRHQWCARRDIDSRGTAADTIVETPQRHGLEQQPPHRNRQQPGIDRITDPVSEVTKTKRNDRPAGKG